MRRSREEDILNTVEDLFRGRLQNYYDFIHSGYDIQVLTPTKKGLLGTIHLNEVLQGVLNPPSEEGKEIRKPDFPGRGQGDAAPEQLHDGVEARR